MTELKKAVKRFVNLQLSSSSSFNYHLVTSHLFDIIYNIGILKEKGLSKIDIREQLKDALTIIHGGSPFFERMESWPRGYAGDFETIQYLMDGKNHAQKGSVPYYVEQYALFSPAVQQHRNKIEQQTKQILTVCAQKKDRILSIGCGGNIDIQNACEMTDLYEVELVLLDGDNGALEYSRNRLKHIKSKLTFIHGNIFRNLIKLKEIGRFDLIIVGGLFDYFKDQTVAKLLRQLRQCSLNDRGTLFFTNISPDNPDKILMEYLANWVLIERPEQCIYQLACHAGFSEKEITVRRDKTNITCLVELKKGGCV